MNFALTRKFKFANSFFKKKQLQKWTRKSPNEETNNKIDYILTNKYDILENMEVLNKVNIGSDHWMIRCTIK